MERAICDEAKIAEHSRYVCFNCRRKIMKGLPVVRKGETTKYGFQSHSFCHRCAERQIKEGKDVIKAMAEAIENTEKQFIEAKAKATKALVLEALEYAEELKNKEIELKRSNEEWEKRQKEWAKEHEERDKEFDEFKKWKQNEMETKSK